MCGLTFDWANFINTLVGAILGGIISLVISYYFFIKGSGLETLMKWLSHNLGDTYIRQRFPQFFMGSAHFPNVTPKGPPNLDVPRLQSVVFSSKVVKPGEAQEILCRVVDEGWNFPSNNGGLSITDHSGTTYQVVGVGYGYMYACINIPKSAQLGTQRLTFTMNDIDKSTQKQLNTFVQYVDIQIV